MRYPDIGYNPFRWIKLSILLFIGAAATGWAASLLLSVPFLNAFIITFSEYRPLHTFFSLMAVVAGAVGFLKLILLNHGNGQYKWNHFNYGTWTYGAFIVFLCASAILIIAGVTTGREYFSWFPLLTILLLAVLVWEAYVLCANTNVLTEKSPEGFWLVGLGLGFIIAGLVESHFWLLPVAGNDIVKNLTIQWHGIDTFIAGLNALIYGGSIFIIQRHPKKLRKIWLYVIAGFSILFTFGHHHYVSPQPHYLKILAFLASMAAIVSFIRHFKSYKKKEQNGRHDSKPKLILLKSVEMWTLVAVGSGILFAIPQVNLVVHGTYLIVIHAMGSMIGVNLLLILLAGLHLIKKLSRKQEKRFIRSIHGINYSLWTLWIVLGGAGLIKGVMRMYTTYWDFMDAIEPFLLLFPAVGLVLTASIISAGMVIYKNVPEVINKMYDTGVVKNIIEEPESELKLEKFDNVSN